jgi:hypothetical protein
MEAELVRPLPVQISPKSFELEADAVSIISSLESLPAPPEPFPLDQLLRATSATIEDDTFSDTDTVHYDVSRRVGLTPNSLETTASGGGGGGGNGGGNAWRADTPLVR